MVFNREELGKLNLDALHRLAKYLDINIYSTTKKGTIIKKILRRLATPVDIIPEPEIKYLSGETQESPLYSARIRRIVQSKLEGEN